MSRDRVARWVLEKLLASFFISAVIIWGPVIGVNVLSYGMGTTYTVITSISVAVSLVSYILIPRDFGILRRVRARVHGIRETLIGDRDKGEQEEA